jgi:hypothetical protein
MAATLVQPPSDSLAAVTERNDHETPDAERRVGGSSGVGSRVFHPTGDRSRSTQPSTAERTHGRLAVVLYVLAMVAVVVGVDILFLSHHFWARLLVNVGIVLAFLAFYVRFLKRP